MKKYNIKARSDREQALKYKHDEDFFETIDTEAKAYWLGFIYADGYITAKRLHGNRKLGIAISKRDIELLEEFKKDINAEHPIKEYEANGYENSSNYVRIIITSEKTVSDIEKKGVLEQKTEVLTFPTEDQVPRSLLNHFIRGYMDGDGCILYSQKTKDYGLSFCGTLEFIEGIKQVLNITTKINKRHDNDVNNYNIKVGGNRQVENILNYIYQDATIFLKRKYNRYLNLIKENKRMDNKLRLQKEEYEKEKDSIVQEYSTLKNIKHLAKKLNMSTTKIGDILKERGIYIYPN